MDFLGIRNLYNFVIAYKKYNWEYGLFKYLAVACSISEHISSNLVIWRFISVFRAIVYCWSPQAGIIKLEWWIEAMSKVVSMAVLWVDNKTYQGNLDEFWPLKNAIGAIFCRQNWLAWHIKITGNRVRLSGRLLLTLRISQAFPSARNRKIAGLQALL